MPAREPALRGDDFLYDFKTGSLRSPPPGSGFGCSCRGVNCWGPSRVAGAAGVALGLAFPLALLIFRSPHAMMVPAGKPFVGVETCTLTE
jgi:hypothetical protein